ncbi:MAG TPA: insulinase family protein [Opitutaceae bacterium]|nr:insulinase family protein [Opitutaceae bacterium]
MKHRTLPFLTFGLLLLAASALAAPLRAPATDWPHLTSDIPVDPAVTWGRLDNGLRYAILPNAEPRDRVSVRLLVVAGALMETDAQRGLAHFIEHMGFNGTRNFPPGQLIEYFQRLGMAFGPDTNASTGFDRTMYQVELPKNDADSLREAFKALRDYADGNLFLPEEIEQERGVILAEKRDRDSAEYRAMLAEFGFLLPATIIPQRLPIGTEEVIRSAPREQFLDYYNTWYRPERMALVVVGQVEPAAVAPLIAAAFGDMKAQAPARPEPELGRVEMPAEVRALVHRDPELPRISIGIQTVAPYAFEPDTAATRLKYLPRQLAATMFNRRLEELAKKEGAPFTSASVHTSEMLDFLTNSSIDIATTKPEQWRAALAVAEQELRRALTHGFQPAELREATANMANALEDAVKQAPTRRSSGLAAGLLATIHGHNVFSHPVAIRDLYQPALARVTVDDCLAALREDWKAAGRLIFVSGNLPAELDEAAVTAAYTESTAMAVAAPARIDDATWGYADFGPAGTIAARREIPDLGIVQVDFANGVQLNLKKTDFQAATIVVSARLGGGVLTMPADKPGLDIYAQSAAGLMGLGKHSVDELRRILAGRSVGAGFFVEKDAFLVTGQTTPKDLELQLQLLAATVSDPGFRPEGERLLRRGMAQYYNRLQHTPEGVYPLEIARQLASDDPRFGLPSMETLERYSMADVRAWLAPELAAGPLELNIVGDIDPEATIALAARTFGTLPPRGEKPAYAAERKVAYPAAGFTAERKVQTEIPRGTVFVFWPTNDALDVQRNRRLGLLAATIEDRLRLKIREGLGGAYSPDASHEGSLTFPGYGVLSVRVGVDPAQAPTILATIREIADSLRTGGITDDELVRMKQPVLTGILESARTNSYWLGNVLGGSRELPQRLDWARNRTTDIAAITREEIDALAAEYLRPERLISYIVLPEPMPTAPADQPAPTAPAAQ